MRVVNAQIEALSKWLVVEDNRGVARDLVRHRSIFRLNSQEKPAVTKLLPRLSQSIVTHSLIIIQRFDKTLYSAR